MKYIFIYLLAFSPFIVLAQSNYHKGLFIDNNNQEHSGYIDYREWEENPKFIYFKNAFDDKDGKKIYPAAIKSFSIEGLEEYHTYAGDITLNRTRFPDLAKKPNNTTKKNVVFLKQITSGQYLTLYTYTDSLKTRYFIQEKQEQPFELLYQKIYDEAGTSILTLKTYVGQLNDLASKYASVNSKLVSSIETTDYGSQIEKIVNVINGKNEVVAKPHPAYARYFLGLGLTLNATHFTGDDAFANGQKPTTIAPTFNAGIDLFINPNIQKVVFRTELSFSYNNPTFIASGLSGGAVVTNTYTFKQYNLSITPQLIFNVYNKDAVKIYIDGGMAFNFSQYGNSTYNINIPNSQSNIPYNLERLWFSFPLQVGVVLNKRIDLFASYTPFTSYTDYYFVSIRSQIYAAGVHLLLGKHK